MNPRRLLHTTAMRLALRYALFYAVLIAMGLGLLYLSTNNYVDAHIAVGLEQEIQQLSKLDQEQGRQQLKTVIETQSRVNNKSGRYYLLDEIYSSNKTGNLLGWPPQLKADGKVKNISIEDNLISGHNDDQDGYWPVIAVTLTDGSRLLVAQSIRQSEDIQEFILATMAAILAVSVLLALIMGWRLGRNMLDHVDRINETAQKVTVGDFSKRIPLSGQDDEFDELSNHLNTMLNRIETLLSGMRQVSDNVAHDLRKPLARMRNRIEITLLEKRKGDEYRHAMEETLHDMDELMRTFNALLEIAQAEAGSFRGEWDSVNLTDLLQELSELYLDQSEVRQQTFTSSIEANLIINGNRHLLAQAISNLLDNSFKYSKNAGSIHLEAKKIDSLIHVTVCDNGTGIPIEQYEKVLHRFVRLEEARSTSGNGLGLSLVKAVADLHKAQLTFNDNHPGLCVSIIFSI